MERLVHEVVDIVNPKPTTIRTAHNGKRSSHDFHGIRKTAGKHFKPSCKSHIGRRAGESVQLVALSATASHERAIVQTNSAKAAGTPIAWIGFADGLSGACIADPRRGASVGDEGTRGKLRVRGCDLGLKATMRRHAAKNCKSCNEQRREVHLLCYRIRSQQASK